MTLLFRRLANVLCNLYFYKVNERTELFTHVNEDTVEVKRIACLTFDTKHICVLNKCFKLNLAEELTII